MKVAVITEWTPTPENRGGISALHYSLIKYRPSDVEVKIFTYNLNHISKEEIDDLSKKLCAEIRILKYPQKWSSYISKKWKARYELYLKKLPPSDGFYDKELINLFDEEDCDFFFLYPRAMYAFIL